MKLFRLFTIRSFKQRPVRMFLSMFGIVLGVATIAAIGITNLNALNSITRLFEETSGKADLVINASDSDTFPDHLLNDLEHINQIDSAVPSLSVFSDLANSSNEPQEPGLSFFGTSQGGILLFGINPLVDPDARSYNILEGEFLHPNSRRNEIVLGEIYAENNELAVGDSIELIGSTVTQRFRVTGILAKEGPGRLNNGAVGIVDLESVQLLTGNERMIDLVDLIIDPSITGAEELEGIQQLIQERIGEDYSVLFPADQGKRQQSMLGNYQIGLNFLSGISLFVGIFLIFNAFSMTIVERTREIGMLRCVGMTKAQITSIVLSEALVLGVVGAGLGAAAGIGLSRGLGRLMQVLLAQDVTGMEIPVNVLIYASVIGILSAVLAAVFPALQAGRISPLEALRAVSRTENNWILEKGWIAGTALLIVSTVILVLNPFPYDVQFRLGSMVVFSLFIGGTLLIPASVSTWERFFRPLIRIAFGRIGKLGSLNIVRARMRTTLTVVALLIGVSMLIVVWAMTESFKSDLDAWLEGYIGGDLFITSTLPMDRAVQRRIESVPGVLAAAPQRYLEVEWRRTQQDREQLSFMGFEPMSHSRVTSFLFSEDTADSQQAMNLIAEGNHIFVSSVISEKFGMQPGSRMNLITRKGEKEFTVAAVVVDYYNEGMVISGSWTDMKRYFHEDTATVFLVKTEPEFQPSAVADEIDDRYGKRDKLLVNSNESMLDSVNTLMRQAFSMFDVLALITLFVGFFSISNTMTMNVFERTREIGMLRSVGMTRRQVRRLVLAEAVMLGIMGGIMGLVFGIILSRVFILAMTAMSGYSLVYRLPLGRVLIALVVSIVVSLAAALTPAGRASRTNILDAIKYE